MRIITMTNSVPAFFLLLLIAASSVTLTSCDGDGNGDSRYDAATRGDSLRNADGTYTFDDGTVLHADGRYIYRDGSVRNADGTEFTGTMDNDGRSLSPAEERTETVNDLQRMRTRLMTELETVRNRLNEGTLTPDEQAKQTSRAGELAQGLERLDRAIEEVNMADDTTWPNLRENSRKGAEDFRAWMKEQNMEMEG